MALKLSVKIGDVTNLSDARYAAGMGVDYIGFNINHNSEHFVTPEVFSEIINWISGVGIIGEIGETFAKGNDAYGAILLETSNASVAQTLNKFVFRLDGTSIDIQEVKDKIAQNPNASFYILELTPDTLVANEQDIVELCSKHPIYLSSEFNETLLDKVVNQLKPEGIEIKGGLEDQPGFKDYDGIADVLEWLEID